MIIKNNNFIYKIINDDIKNKIVNKITTRFAPEPNGFLHIGHIKSIILNFEIANTYDSICYLRFDDTNPEKEEELYINQIKKDISWLGYDIKNNITFASDYFQQIYDFALLLIKKNKAYICDLDEKTFLMYKGDWHNQGYNSPYRDRTIDENINLFQGMKNGLYKEGSKTLRAKINMKSGNINLRDPVLYRIKFKPHYKTHNKWCIYPTYSFAHPIEDVIEKITHSLCTLEFEEHKPFYKWVVKEIESKHKPKQIEFSKFKIDNFCTSKRLIKNLIDNNIIQYWDDPRILTIQGMKNRGYTQKIIKSFFNEIDISKKDTIIQFKLFEKHIRKELNNISIRKNVVLDPLLVEIDNLSNQDIIINNHPTLSYLGQRKISISNKIFIEKNDFKENINTNEKKLSLNQRIRLINACVIECYKIEKDKENNIVKIKCKYLPETFKGQPSKDGKKENGIIHWVDTKTCIDIKIYLYDSLFNNNINNIDHIDLKKEVNKNSCIITNGKAEKSLSHNSESKKHFQFIRLGYFYKPKQQQNTLIFYRIIKLKQSHKIQDEK